MQRNVEKWREICREVLMTFIREALLEKKMFSFGHCPNYLSLPPPPPNLGNLYHFFLNAKNVDLSGIQRLKLKIMQKVTKK